MLEQSKAILNAAKRKFGTTDSLNEAGYLLPDGALLDFKRLGTSDNLSDMEIDCFDECGDYPSNEPWGSPERVKYDECCDRVRDKAENDASYLEHSDIAKLSGIDSIDDFLMKTCSARIVQPDYREGVGGAIVVQMSPNCEPTQAQLDALRNADEDGYEQVFFDVYDPAAPAAGSKVSVRTEPRYVALAIKRAYDTAYRGAPERPSILSFL